MDIKIKFWLTAVIVSIFLAPLTSFLGSFIVIAAIAMATSLLVCLVFKKENIDFMRLGVFLSIGILIVFVIQFLIVYRLSMQLSQVAISDSPTQTITTLFAPPLYVVYSFIILLIFFNLPFVIREKFPNYFRKFVLGAIALMVFLIVLASPAIIKWIF